jgi:hypothetical protein
MIGVQTSTNGIGAWSEAPSNKVRDCKFHDTAEAGVSMPKPQMGILKTHSMLIALVRLLAKQAVAEYLATLGPRQLQAVA